MNRTPLVAFNPTHQPVQSQESSKALAASAPGSPRLGSGGRHGLPELTEESLSLSSPGPVQSFAATGLSESFTSPLTLPLAPVPAQAYADSSTMAGPLTLTARDASSGSASKQVSWREESPYKPGKKSALEMRGADQSIAGTTGGAVARTSTTTTTTTTTATTATTTTTATATATAVFSATAGASSTPPKSGSRTDRKLWSVWSKNKENSPGRPKLLRNISTPQKGVAVNFSRQRLDTSPAWDLPSSTPTSPDRQNRSDVQQPTSPTRTPIDRSRSLRPQWKSPHAVISPGNASSGNASPAFATAPDFQSPFARTYSSLELPKFHRIDEPIVVISALGSVVGMTKIHLARCAQERPIDEGKRRAIEDMATNLAMELNCSRPNRAGLNKALLKLALLVRDVDPARYRESFVLKYQIMQMAAAIEFMPDELPAKWRIGIESDAVEFGVWVRHGIHADQPDRKQGQ